MAHACWCGWPSTAAEIEAQSLRVRTNKSDQPILAN